VHNGHQPGYHRGGSHRHPAGARDRPAEAGIRALSLFGSVARGEARPDSDVDLATEFDPAAKMDLIRMIDLEFELCE
jgi:predicted nucleotidyltransferase